MHINAGKYKRLLLVFFFLFIRRVLFVTFVYEVWVCNFAHSKFEQFEEQLIEGKISFIVIIIDSDSEQLTLRTCTIKKMEPVSTLESQI